MQHAAVDQSQAGGHTADIKVSGDDKAILRELAKRVAELAARPSEDQKRDRWYAHNGLRPGTAMVFCDPENGWSEILPDDSLRCTGELARTWEMKLRKEIFWGGQMGDDRVTEDYFDVPHVFSESGWGMHEIQVGGEHGGAYRWEAPLKRMEDIEKLRFPEIRVDGDRTGALLNLAQETFGDVLRIRVKSAWWWTLGLTLTYVKLRGLEQMMYDMMDYPEEMHRLMAFLRDGTMARLDFLEKNGLLSANTDGTYVGSGGFGWTHELPRKKCGEQVRTADMWGFCESQETVSVSPAMFGEFVFPYQLPLLKRFGLNCYGCCEPLHNRWEIVKNTPRLRRVSVSPWCDLPRMAEMLGGDYILSVKPNPAHLAVEHLDEDFIRKGLRETMDTARRFGCVVEIIMKDNNTLGGNPQNAVRWCAIAREEAAR